MESIRFVDRHTAFNLIGKISIETILFLIEFRSYLKLTQCLWNHKILIVSIVFLRNPKYFVESTSLVMNHSEFDGIIICNKIILFLYGTNKDCMESI